MPLHSSKLCDSVLTVAYLANQFPAAVEPYVGEEIQELRRRGVRVIPGSVRRPDAAQHARRPMRLWTWRFCRLQPFELLTLLAGSGARRAALGDGLLVWWRGCCCGGRNRRSGE